MILITATSFAMPQRRPLALWGWVMAKVLLGTGWRTGHFVRGSQNPRLDFRY
ncbi:hypothetical protein [Aldersonia kunmingensis]|uniref:hypothetical protein n=1 Tax=Aldersonia kunmingensis TaxID=408066 RepID=UPI000A4F58C9|nr:hypothetical protein [Aldersonia kunmingensis]